MKKVVRLKRKWTANILAGMEGMENLVSMELFSDIQQILHGMITEVQMSGN